MVTDAIGRGASLLPLASNKLFQAYSSYYANVVKVLNLLNRELSSLPPDVSVFRWLYT